MDGQFLIHGYTMYIKWRGTGQVIYSQWLFDGYPMDIQWIVIG